MMKQTDFYKWRVHLLEFEGGFSNNPNDHGGYTNMGVTYTTYLELKDQLDIQESFEDLTMDSHLKIMKHYAKQAGAFQMKSGKVGAFFAEERWMGGPGAIRFYQEKLQLPKTGKFDEQQIKKINSYPSKLLFEKLYKWRLERYDRIVANDPSQWEFYNGWVRRADEFHELFTQKKKIGLWIYDYIFIAVLLMIVLAGLYSRGGLKVRQ